MKKTCIIVSVITGLALSHSYGQTTLSVKRQDIFSHGVVGHVHSDAEMYIKIGTSIRGNTFALDAAQTKNFSFTNSGTPTFLFYFPTPGLTSNYYPLPTISGTETRIYATDPGMTYFPGNYGYSVIVKCTGTNQYTFAATQFNMSTPMTPFSGTMDITNNSNDSKTLLYPNPGHGYAELEYTAVTNEKLSISITDINGRMISRYTTDLQKGNNRLPVDIRNAANGNYFVSWQSDSGNSGTLKMIKE